MKPASALVLAAVALLAAGCAARNERMRELRLYDEKANVTAAENDQRIRLFQLAAARYPDDYRVAKEAKAAGKTIVHPTFLGTANFGYPAHAASLPKVWVLVIIGREGSVDSVECHPDGEAPVSPAHAELITTTVRSWKFQPKSIEGVAVRCPNVFPVLVDGDKFHISSPRELND